MWYILIWYMKKKRQAKYITNHSNSYVKNKRTTVTTKTRHQYTDQHKQHQTLGMNSGVIYEHVSKNHHTKYVLVLLILIVVWNFKAQLDKSSYYFDTIWKYQWSSYNVVTLWICFIVVILCRYRKMWYELVQLSYIIKSILQNWWRLRPIQNSLITLIILYTLWTTNKIVFFPNIS